MRKAEERLNKGGEPNPMTQSAPLDSNARNPEIPVKLPAQSEGEHPTASAIEWIAYGQMTPGFLSEISGFIACSVRGASECVRNSAKPELTKLIQEVDRVRSLLEAWTESALFLPSVMNDCIYADLVQVALNARKAELSRWKIKTEFEDTTASDEACKSPSILFRALLHVIQFCIEQLRESAGESRLFVRIQKAGGHMETAFLCDSGGALEAGGIPKQTSFPYASLRSKNVELRAAQRLLDTIGGTLVLENVSETQRAVRIHLGSPVLSTDKRHDEQSQNRQKS